MIFTFKLQFPRTVLTKMENDARVAWVGGDNATSKKLLICAVIYLILVINGVHRVSLNPFSLKL